MQKKILNYLSSVVLASSLAAGSSSAATYPHFEQFALEQFQMAAGDIGPYLNAIEIVGACNSWDRFDDRAWDVIYFLSNPFGERDNLNHVVGASSMNCSCVRSMVEGVGINWHLILDFLGRGPDEYERSC